LFPILGLGGGGGLGLGGGGLGLGGAGLGLGGTGLGLGGAGLGLGGAGLGTAFFTTLDITFLADATLRRSLIPSSLRRSVFLHFASLTHL
jgi:hypothetical protein